LFTKQHFRRFGERKLFVYNICLFLCFDVAPFYSEATHDKWIAKEHAKGVIIVQTFESKTDAAFFEKGHKSTNSSVMWNTTIQFEAGATVVISCFTCGFSMCRL
jgi:hypothetical protein